MKIHFQIAASRLVVGLLAGALLAGCGASEDSLSWISPPFEFRATPGSYHVTLDWEEITDALGYLIYFSDTEAVSNLGTDNVDDDATPYVHGELDNGSTYYYVISAYNQQRESVISAELSATPSAAADDAMTPLEITIGNGYYGMSVSWTDNGTADSYNIYWSTTPGVTSATGIKVLNATNPYYHDVFIADTSYYFVVTAVTDGVESAESRQVGAAGYSAIALNGTNRGLLAMQEVAPQRPLPIKPWPRSFPTAAP